MAPKEITPNPLSIKSLPQKLPSKEITPAQGILDLGIECQTEIQGIGMGVLTDGTPFLTQRGLARLCGVENAHIGTISAQWNESPQLPRISTIKDLLASRGVSVTSPHIAVRDRGIMIYAHPDVICLAVLEYYAFEAGANCKPEARKNFRLLAGSALHDFIYAQVGYDPNRDLPEVWRIFHDRVSLTYNAVPPGYFGIFKEIADMIVTLGQAGLRIDAKFVPDISVGIAWSKYWTDHNLDRRYGERRKCEHNYPSYFPQAQSNPQLPWCYPESALGAFRRWFRDLYIAEGKFSNYLMSKVRSRELTASFVQLAITAYIPEG
jgi:hypothetical protein